MVDAIGIIANLSQNWVDLDREMIESNDFKKLKGYFLKCAKFLFEINKKCYEYSFLNRYYVFRKREKNLEETKKYVEKNNIKLNKNELESVYLKRKNKNK